MSSSKTTKKTAPSPFSLCTFILLSVIVLQWAFCSLLLYRLSNHRLQLDSQQIEKQRQKPLDVDSGALVRSATKILPLNNNDSKEWEGVGVIMIYRAPGWMHSRYTAAIYNALTNLPPNWGLQIFINMDWASTEFLPWHPGFRRLMEDYQREGSSSRIIFTPIPSNYTAKEQKPKYVVISEWFWNSVAADRVLLFTANGAFCANHKVQAPEGKSAADTGSSSTSVWDALIEADLDYCGTPSAAFNGQGGDGSAHSYRNRRAMLRVLRYAAKHMREPLYQAQGLRPINKISKKQGFHLGVESSFFLSIMIHMNEHPNEEDSSTFRLATPEQTMMFGGVKGLTKTDSPSALARLPLVVSGTHARLDWKERDILLRFCPEVKIIFPSLHEPSCFGANPDGAKCKATICALQDEIPRSGC